MNKKVRVIAFYLPQYHPTLDNDTWWGKGFTEWTNVGKAKPLFRGHYQPKVPAWGYTDEKDPKVMEQKIQAASTHGIDVFIFDWYTYEGKPFLNRCLDEGFLHASNTDSIKFALMWANHDWMELYHYTAGDIYTMERLLLKCSIVLVII